MPAVSDSLEEPSEAFGAPKAESYWKRPSPAGVSKALPTSAPMPSVAALRDVPEELTQVLPPAKAESYWQRPALVSKAVPAPTPIPSVITTQVATGDRADTPQTEFSERGRLCVRRASRLALGAVALSLPFGAYAFAAHLTVTTKTLGSGSAPVNRCMTGSSMTFTYNLNTSSDLSTGNSPVGSNPASPYGVVVGNIASGCAGGTLTVELSGTTSPLPESLGAVTIANSSPCALSGGVYVCDFQVSGIVPPGNVTDNYAVITGP